MKSTKPAPQRRIYISELAAIINRRETTIRGWTRPIADGRPKLPPKFMPRRDPTASQGGWRWWTEDQVEGIQVWMTENNVRPGAGLARYKSSPERDAKMIAGMRGQRKVA